MKIDLSEQVALVTGAGRGIGKAIAIGLAGANASIIINDANSRTAGETADEIRALGGTAVPVQADVSCSKEVRDMVGLSVKSFGKIDILVNNAGIVSRKPAEDLSEEEWDKVIRINLKGVFLCCQAVGKHMIKGSKGGKIINIASIMGSVALPPRAAYCASKGGIISLTRDLATEWAKHLIRVNAISPGRTITEMTEAYFSPKKIRSFLLGRIPLRRLGNPADVAGLVVFFASEHADYITGQNFCVDGGWTVL